MRSSTRLGRCTFAAVAAAVLCVPAGAEAAPGDLDPDFGRGGILTVKAPEEQGVTDLAVEASGSIRAVGFTGTTTCSHVECRSRYDELLAGVTRGGRLDPSFGDGGLLEPGAGLDQFEDFPSIALQAGGSFFSAHRTRLERFGPSGGGPNLPPAVGGPVADLLTLPDGRLLVGATTFDGSARFLIERRLPGGQPDLAFGVDGSVDIGIGFGASLTELVLDPNGGFWALGRSSETSIANSQLTVAHFNADGSPDPAFSDDGISTFALRSGAADSATMLGGVPVGAGGDLVVVGRGVSGGTQAIRIQPGGTADPGFGDNGIADIDSQVPGWTVGVASLPDSQIALIRERGLSIMDEDGNVDQSFSGDGLASPQGLRARGGVGSGDSILLYGHTRDLDMSMARLELDDDGVADADADGVPDSADPCPEFYGARKRDGCPVVKRTVTLRYQRKARRFIARVRPICPGTTRVRLTRRVAGSVRKRWRETVSASEPKAIFNVRARRGRFRVSIPRELAAPAGVCLAARSKITRVKPKRR